MGTRPSGLFLAGIGGQRPAGSHHAVFLRRSLAVRRDSRPSVTGLRLTCWQWAVSRTPYGSEAFTLNSWEPAPFFPCREGLVFCNSAEHQSCDSPAPYFKCLLTALVI